MEGQMVVDSEKQKLLHTFKSTLEDMSPVAGEMAFEGCRKNPPENNNFELFISSLELLGGGCIYETTSFKSFRTMKNKWCRFWNVDKLLSDWT